MIYVQAPIAISTQSQFIAGKDDSSSNFARGFYTIGREALPACLDQIRKQADSCEHSKAFFSITQ